MAGMRRKPGVRGAIEARWRAIRKSYPWDTPLMPEDAAFIHENLQNHPDVAEKIGVGIAYFIVADDGQGDCCVRAVRIDGTSTPISLKSCLNKCSPFRNFSDACRATVACDAVAAKNAAFKLGAGPQPGDMFDATDAWLMVNPTITCPASGATITYDQAHAHHADPWPFHKIVRAFIESRPDIDPDNLGAYVCRAPGLDTKVQLKDSALAMDFYCFHRERAVLVVVAGAANVSNGLKQQGG
jgi:hypothetical protein